MSKSYDLHSHSTASDGTLTPTQLVARAAEAGVDFLALTDHDDVSGIEEARMAAHQHGMTLIPGIELSVTWSHQTIHILGLNIKEHTPVLAEGIKRQHEFRRWRAEEIARRLAKKGIPGASEGAAAFANGPIISRTHFARFLVEQGKAASIREVFSKYLVRGKPGYVPGDWACLEEVLDWINVAGGQAVIAHPARYRLSSTKLRQLIAEFREQGGQGLEVVSGSHNRDECRYMAELSERFELYASMGSDYHGPGQAYAELGRLAEMPTMCVPIWDSQDWKERLAPQP